MVTASVTFTHGAIGKWRANRPASSNWTTKSVRQLFSSVQGNAIFLIAPLQHSWNVNFFLSAGGKSVKSDAFPDENGFSRGYVISCVALFFLTRKLVFSACVNRNCMFSSNALSTNSRKIPRERERKAKYFHLRGGGGAGGRKTSTSNHKPNKQSLASAERRVYIYIYTFYIEEREGGSDPPVQE